MSAIQVPGDDLRAFLDKARECLQRDDLDGLEGLIADTFPDPASMPPAAGFVAAIQAFKRDDLAKAVARLDGAAQVQEVANALAVMLALAGDLNGSTFQRKMANALPSDPALAPFLAFLPDFSTVYFGISEQPMLKKARAAFLSSDLAAAEYWFGQHLAFFPDTREAYLGQAQSLTLRDDPWSAVDVLRAGMHRMPGDAALLSALGLALSETGACAEGAACHRWATASSPDDATIAAMGLIDQLRDPTVAPSAHVAATRAWGRRFSPAGDAAAPGGDRAKNRRTIAYVVGSLGLSSAGQALAAVIARHDPRRFRVLGFGLGELSVPYNVAFQKSFDRWHDIAGMDPLTLRAMLKSENVDMIVWAAGFGDPELLTVLGSRIAPVQVVWGGMPYGSGLAAVDGCVVDRALLGDGELADRPVFLDVPATLTLPGAPVPASETKREGFTLAADAFSWELNVATVEWWARLLHAIPDATLLLKDNALSAPRSVDRLLSLFGDYGLTHRVDVVDGVSRSELFADADLVLGSLPMPSAQIALDALACGTPVLVREGFGAHERGASSLLRAFGLGESMVAATVDEFVHKAVAWHADAAGREAFRRDMPARIGAAEFLAPGTICASLEAALETLWQG